MGAADGVGRGLAQAQRAHLALLHQLAHGADRILDRHRWIDAVLVVEVDHVDAQPLEARIARRLHVLRRSIDAVGAAGPLDLAELGGEHDAVAARAGKRLADQLLVVAPAIHVGAVEHGDATIQRVVDQRDALGIVGLAIGA